DNICPAPLRVFVDDLAIGNGQDDDEKQDRKADGNGPGNGGSSSEHQNQQDFFRGVGYGRNRVRRKDRESDGFRQPLVCCLGAFEWVANQPTLHKHNDHYRIEVQTCTSKKELSDARGRMRHSSMRRVLRTSRRERCVSRLTGSWAAQPI